MKKKYQIIIFVCSLFFGAVVIYDAYKVYSYHFDSVFTMLPRLAQYQVKGICSCLFIEENEELYCNSWVSSAFPLVPYIVIHEKEKFVQAPLFGATAAFISERKGCR
jgi:hypothetical protein